MPKWQIRGAKSKQSPGVSKTVPPSRRRTLQTWAPFMGKKMIKTANDQLGIHGYPIDKATKWWTKAWTLDKSSIQAPWCENVLKSSHGQPIIKHPVDPVESVEYPKNPMISHQCPPGKSSM